MSLDLLARVKKEEARQERLERCRKDKWFLATQVLKRGWNPSVGGDESPFPGKGLTEELHKPLFDWSDARRNRLLVGRWTPRWHHKTEEIIAEIIQDILIDPGTSLGYFHSVDALASMLVSEVGNHLQNNPELRRLEPIGIDDEGKPYNILPARNAKKFVTADQLTVRRPFSKFSRFPTLFGKGAGAEIAGLHMRKAYLDDIITLRTIQNSELPKIATWYQSNLMPVVDDGIIRVSATRWHPDAKYEEWIKSEEWCSVVLPCSIPPEFDFMEDPSVIDWTKDKINIPGETDLDKGVPIYGPRAYRETQRKKLFHFQKQMAGDFAAQMMNEPSPASEKPWDRDKEVYVTKKDIDGVGFKVVLSDPAPAKMGSMDALGAKRRGDSTKDYWANAVLKLRKNGMRNEIILLNGSMSREWDVDQGFDEVCRLKRIHGAAHHAIESTGQAIALYQKSMDQAARRAGVPNASLELEGTYRGQAKNLYFAALASAMRSGEFVIYEGCDRAFLDMFLNQAREWRPMENGGNGLRYDDCANVVSFATDAVFAKHMPMVAKKGFEAFNPLSDDEPELVAPSRTRHSAA